MMLKQQLLVKLLVAASTVAVHANATPQVSTGFEAVVGVTRRLQDPSAQCGPVIGELIGCFVSNCLNEPCTTQSVNPPPSDTEESCDTLEREICTLIDDTCCPPCTEVSGRYLDCIVSSALGTVCPDASCIDYVGGDALADGNATTTTTNVTTTNVTNSNITTMAPTSSPPPPTSSPPPPTSSPPAVTSPPTSNPLPDIPEDFGGTIFPSLTDDGFFDFDFCGESLTAIFTCYSENCGMQNCEDNLANGDDGSITSCDDIQSIFCSVFDEADVCCPDCTDQTGAYLTCVLANTIVPFCPTASDCQELRQGGGLEAGTTNRAFGGDDIDESSKAEDLNEEKQTATEIAGAAGTMLTSGGANHKTSIAVVTSMAGLLTLLSFS